MKNIWNETTIRKKLARLDLKTELKGAMSPIRCYSSERAKYYQDKYKAGQERTDFLDRYGMNSFIMHPRFRRVKIVEIIGTDANS